MTEYHVEWSIDIEANSAREAAEKARQMQQWPREGYWCGVFDVYDEEGKYIAVDLDEDEEVK